MNYLPLILLVFVSSKGFISKPPDSLVGINGKSITFNWEVNSKIFYRKWQHTGVDDIPKDLIIAQVNSGTKEQININPGKLM